MPPSKKKKKLWQFEDPAPNFILINSHSLKYIVLLAFGTHP